MANFDILKNEQDFIDCMKVVEEYRLYAFSLMNANKILPTTYLKVEAAANSVVGRVFNRLTNFYIGDILVSDESLEAIVNSAISENNRTECIKPVMQQYIEMIMDYVAIAFNRTTREVLETDADFIIKTIENLENKLKGKV